jgi:hypothetical protein
MPTESAFALSCGGSRARSDDDYSGDPGFPQALYLGIRTGDGFDQVAGQLWHCVTRSPKRSHGSVRQLSSALQAAYLAVAS